MTRLQFIADLLLKALSRTDEEIGDATQPAREWYERRKGARGLLARPKKKTTKRATRRR